MALKSQLLDTSESCKRLESFHYKLAAVTGGITKKNLSELYIKCRKSLTPEHELLYLKILDIKANKVIESIRKTKNGRLILNIIKKIEKNKQEKRKSNKLNASLLQSIEILKSNQKEDKKFISKIHDLLNLCLVDEKNLVSELILVAIYFKTGNPTKANLIIENLVTKDVYQSLVDPPLKINGEDELNFFKGKIWALLEILKSEYEKDDKNYFYFKLLTSYLSQYLKGEEAKEFIRKFDAAWSLQELNTWIKSPIWGYNLINLWFPEVYKRQGERQAYEFLEESLKKQMVKYDYRKYLWPLKYYLPKNDGVREMSYKKISTLQNDTNAYDTDLYIRLLENRVIRDSFKVRKLEKRPLYIIKRKFYRDLLENGNGKKYAIFNLVKLGDEDPNILWWLIN